MTDDISKVYAALRSIRYNANNGSQDRPLHHRLSLIANEADKAIATIESATTPAEVGPESFDFGGVSYVRATDHQQRIATLARQLAEAKAVLVSLLTEREHRTDGDLPTLADRCRHLSRGDRDVIQMRGSLIESYKTRAEQAESRLAKAKAENAIATSVHEHERLNLMSQLAEATRRVAEVEDAAGTLEEAVRVFGWSTTTTQRALARLRATLQKEPKE